MPVFTVPVHEYNPCHAPAGTPAGGQFCSEPGTINAEEHSVGKALDTDVYRRNRIKDIAERMVATGPENMAQLQKEVRTRIDLWHDTSGDHNPDAVRMQVATAREFGLKKGDAKMDHLMRAPETDWDTKVAMDRRFLRAEYENTQQWFKDRGITHVSVFRGMRSGLPPGDVGGIAEVTMQPASSWSVARSVADQYARAATKGAGGGVLSTRVPVARVLATTVTGRGDPSLDELILLGGVTNVKIETRI